MKKIFTLILLVTTINFFGQAPIIEGTYFPVINTSIKQVWDTAFGTIAIPPVGPNMVWDYSNQFTHVVDTFQSKMLAPSATPTRCSQYFPTATHATFIRIPYIGSPADSIYSYLKINQSGIYNLGGFNVQHQYDSTLINNTPELFTPSSINYLSTYTDTTRSVGYAKHYSGFSIKIKETKRTTAKYVGYGTLKLPNGVFNNVAQLRDSIVRIDSIFVDYLNNGNYVFNPSFTYTTKLLHYYFLRNNTFASNYLMYLEVNSVNSGVNCGWYTLPVDFGSITGSVYTNTLEIPSNLLTQGQNKAYLYRENSNFLRHDILAITNVDGNGNYKFDSIPYGLYHVAIRPDTTVYNNAMITYFGDSTEWINLSPIVTTTTTSTGNNIHVLFHAPSTNNIGNSVIYGHLTSNLNILRTSSEAQIFNVNPTTGIGIVVKKNPGSSAARTIPTDGFGNYGLDSLDNGAYELFVDIPGLHMAGTYNFTVTNGNVVTGLDFVVGTASVHPVGSIPLVTKEIKNVSTEFMTAYPNPYTSAATIAVNIAESSTILLEVYNILGEKVQTLDNSQKQMGTYKYTFSAKSLNHSSGMYFVKLTIGNKTNVLKIVEQ